MDCDDCLEKLYAFLDQELGSSERKQVANHLDGCTDCGDNLAFEALVESDGAPFTDQDVRAVLEQAAPDTARCLNAKAFERRYAGDEFRRNRTDRRQGYSHPRRQPARAAGECRSRHGFFG